MKAINFLFLATFALGANIDSLSSVTLGSSEAKQDVLSSTKANGGDVWTKDVNNAFTLSGHADASYTISSSNDVTELKIKSGFALNDNVHLNFEQFLILNFDGVLSIGQNAVFSANNSNRTISPQFTDYGGSSKFRLEIKLSLN